MGKVRSGKEPDTRTFALRNAGRRKDAFSGDNRTGTAESWQNGNLRRHTVKQTSLEELMKALEEVDLLILDDIGTENPTEWAAERLYLIVNSRYSAGKPIIATSNFNAAELVNRLKTRDKSGRLIESDVTGQRIVSRLCEMCQPVKIGGVDRRLRFQNRKQ